MFEIAGAVAPAPTDERQAMTRILYDLAGAGDQRFSPHCWKTKMALKHKGLDFETEPCIFTQVKEKVAFAGSERVPTLKDGENGIGDSWAIAEYLEEAYPDAPSLFGSPEGKAFARFANEFADTVMLPPIANAIVYDIHEWTVEADRAYFKSSREEMMRRSFEELRPDRDDFVGRFRAAMVPVRRIVGRQPFLTGDRPHYADYCIFGMLQFARVTSDCELLRANDPVLAWRGRILDLYGGYAAAEPAVAA